MFKVNINVNVNAGPDDSPQATAEWIRALIDELSAGLVVQVDDGSSVAGEEDPSGADEDVYDVPGQLARLQSYWPAFAPRLTRLHEGLVELGFEPKVPDKRGSVRQASYISYVDPVDGRNLGNTNSGTFTFMQKQLRDELEQEAPNFVKIGRHASVHFDTDEKVDYILDVARQHKKD